MKILVTGATGGIGRLIIPKLLEAGHEVIATSKSIEKAKELSFFEQVTYIPFDINDSSNNNLVSFFNIPDTVIHLAWDKLNDYKSEDHVTTILENHRNFVYNLIRNGIKDITVVGTCYEYGLIEGELIETMPSNPIIPYPKGKNLLREYLDELKSQFQFNYKWIRVFYVFGEIYGRKNLYTMINQAISEGQTRFNMSGGQQIRDFLSPQEIAEIIIDISLQNKINGIINCCSGKPIKLVDYINNYLKHKHYQIDLNLGYYLYPDYEPMNSWGNTDKLDEIKLKKQLFN